MKIALKIKTYKIPIERIGEEIKEVPISLSEEDILKTEEVEVKDLQVELTNLTKKVAQFNARQVVYAEKDKTLDYIKKKIITK